MIEQQHRLFFAPDVVLQVIDGEALLLKLQDETVFALNETGARIAQLIEGGEPMESVTHTLSREYGVDAGVVAPEVARMVDVLRSKGLIVDRIV